MRYASHEPCFGFFRFTLLFSSLYVAFGVASPFLPAFLYSRGLTAEQVGLALSLAMTVRLISGPRIADRLHALRIVLAICAAGAMARLNFRLGILAVTRRQSLACDAR